MADNFFDLVGEKFFNPFTNRNKKYNYDLLQLMNNKMSLDNLQVTKDSIVNWIIDYVDNCPIDLINDETGSNEKDIKAFAYDKIRYFVDCGWLIEDYESTKITYQLDENGIKLLAAMENVVQEDKKSLEFSGFVYNIYNNLYTFNTDHATDMAEQIYLSAKQLDAMLRGLNANIRKFLKKLLVENETKPKELLETIFFDYQKKVVLKAFKNFREKDNPSKYKMYIEKRIDELLSEEKIDKLIKNYNSVKHDGISSDKNDKEAREFFEERFGYIREQFEEIENNIQILDRKNAKYITTAKSRLNFLLNEDTDVNGKIINCLKAIEKTEENFFERGYFDLFSCANLDENSLYTPSVKKAKPKVGEIEDEKTISPEQAKVWSDKLFKDDKYSAKAINKYVMKQLGNRQQMHAKDIQISGFADVLKLFLVQVYSGNKNIDYKTTYLDETYKSFGYRLMDYVIERREKQ